MAFTQISTALVLIKSTLIYISFTDLGQKLINLSCIKPEVSLEDVLIQLELFSNPWRHEILFLVSVALLHYTMANNKVILQIMLQTSQQWLKIMSNQ